MQIILITTAALALTFSLNPVFKAINKKSPLRPAGLHIHHSVAGILLLSIGLIAENEVVAAIGLGVYLGHAAEEVYFNKRNFIAALFIFVTH